MIRYFLFALTALVLVGCDSPSSPDDALVVPEGTFELQSFELSSGQIVTVPDPSNYTITFLEDSTINARTDCNLCNGGYTLSESGFEVGLLACTRAACAPDSLEQPYVEALGAAFALELQGSELLIFYPDGALRYRPE